MSISRQSTCCFIESLVLSSKCYLKGGSVSPVVAEKNFIKYAWEMLFNPLTCGFLYNVLAGGYHNEAKPDHKLPEGVVIEICKHRHATLEQCSSLLHINMS